MSQPELSKPTLAASLKKSTLGLLLFALVTAGVVALTQSLTAERIADNRAEAAARLLLQLAPPEEGFQLDLEQPLILPAQPELGHDQPFSAYLAYRQQQPKLLLLPVVAPDGYTGDINLLVALHLDGHIRGVRVTQHQETPGLGDKIETRKSDWIHTFAGRSLDNPQLENWAVKKEGGAFDQFTGATITPRAIVAAVKRSLLWQQQQADRLQQQLKEHAN